jgi:adenosylcobinamide-GDP ribazoletransferase
VIPPLAACAVASLPGVIAGLALAILVRTWLLRWFERRLGGYTGDALGATQQFTELAFYLGWAAGWNWY